MPDPHGHTGPPRVSPPVLPDREPSVGRSTAQIAAKLGAWRGDRRHALVIVPSGRSRVFPFVKVVHGRPGAYKRFLTPPGACKLQPNPAFFFTRICDDSLGFQPHPAHTNLLALVPKRNSSLTDSRSHPNTPSRYAAYITCKE